MSCIFDAGRGGGKTLHEGHGFARRAGPGVGAARSALSLRTRGVTTEVTEHTESTEGEGHGNGWN